MKDCVTLIAVLLPVAACGLIGWRFCRQDKGSWQLAACFAALVIATSIVLLAASGRVSFVRYGEAVVQMDQKLEETRRLTEQNAKMLNEIGKLTEQNKRIARATVDLVTVATHVHIAVEDFDLLGISRSMKTLLKEAGVSDAEIEKHLKVLKSLDSAK